MLIQLTVPSKTFILGEYLALYGGAALLVNTHPRFVLKTYHADKPKITGIHPDSPTYKLLSDYQALLRCYQIDFDDPYDKKGGFGASSAQFLMSYMLIKYLCGENISDQSSSFINTMLNDYKRYSFQPKGIHPSGADLIAQFCGALTYYDKKNGIHQSCAWPFPNIGFYLLRTHAKVSTHLHLQSLSAFPHQQLQNCLAPLLQQIKEGEELEFINTVNQYAKMLEDLNFVSDHTRALLQQIRPINGVVAAKGCGAMGADIILVIVNKTQKDFFLEWAQMHKMTIVTDECAMTSGLKINQYAMPKAV